MILLQHGDLGFDPIARRVEGPLAVAFVSENGRWALDGLLRFRRVSRPLTLDGLITLLNLKEPRSDCERIVRREMHHLGTLFAIIGVDDLVIAEDDGPQWRLARPEEGLAAGAKDARTLQGKA